MKTAGTSITSSFSLKRSFKRRLRERKLIQSCTIKKKAHALRFLPPLLVRKKLGRCSALLEKDFHTPNKSNYGNYMPKFSVEVHFTLNMNITSFMTFSYQSPPIDIFCLTKRVGAPLKICKSCPAPQCDHLVAQGHGGNWERELPVGKYSNRR